MVNKDFKEFMEKENNIDFNYKKIREKTNKKFNIRQLTSVAAVIAIILSVGAISNKLYAKRQWDIEYSNYQNREYKFASIGVKESETNGYTEHIDMNYIYQNDIGVKVDSIMVTDDQFEANLNFKFAEDMKVDPRYFEYGFIVYDDNSQMYGCTIRNDRSSKIYGSQDYNYKYIECVLQELNVDYNKKEGVESARHCSMLGYGTINATEGNIISNISMESVIGFPKSKKIYIRIFNIGFTMMDIEENNGEYSIADYEDFRLSGNAEWIFEIELPERMYNRETIVLKPVKDIPNLQIDKLTVTESKLVIKAKMDKDEEFTRRSENISANDWEEYINNKVFITDDKGNIYNRLPNSYMSTKHEYGFEYSFDINKNMLENKTFYLNIRNHDILYTEELIIDK